jgi:GNAT superfamily N-acetyltransferase
MIRPAAERDLPVLRDVERAAGEGFREIGMAPVADDDPPTIETLRGYVAAGRAWVTEEGGRVVAYLIADLVDGNVHVEQVSVHPDHAHHGHGRALLEHLARWSVDRGYRAMTLTTFTDVPWNGPYYVRCGFRRLDDDEVTPELRVLRAREAEHGLDRWPRACMRRDL